MLNDAHGFKKIYIATGYTDLRRVRVKVPGLRSRIFKPKLVKTR